MENQLSLAWCICLRDGRLRPEGRSKSANDDSTGSLQFEQDRIFPETFCVGHERNGLRAILKMKRRPKVPLP